MSVGLSQHCAFPGLSQPQQKNRYWSAVFGPRVISQLGKTNLGTVLNTLPFCKHSLC